MKKLFTILAVAATLVSCAKEDVVREAAREAIGFDNAFVENSTRSVNDPSLTATSLTGFTVYGYVENAVLFPGTVVNKTITNKELSSPWKYEGTQYWVAGAKYNFAAIAPNKGWSNVTTAVAADKTSISTNFAFVNDGETDLLYDEVENIDGLVEQNATVGFDFRHILSKVKFSFLNGYNVESAKIDVTNVKIENAYANANVALTNADTTWSGWANATLELDFGFASDREKTTDVKESAAVTYAFGETYESLNELFLIPGAAPSVTYKDENNADVTVNAYKVSFDVNLYINNTKVNSEVYHHVAYVELVPQAGYAYDIKAEITAANIDPEHAQEPIEFTVNPIGGWNESNIEAPGYEAPTPGQN